MKRPFYDEISRFYIQDGTSLFAKIAILHLRIHKIKKLFFIRIQRILNNIQRNKNIK